MTLEPMVKNWLIGDKNVNEQMHSFSEPDRGIDGGKRLIAKAIPKVITLSKKGTIMIYLLEKQ
jgi:hypothetical protein